MDTSETYIKMCDCPEIQKHRKKQKDFQVGDVIANHTLGQYSKATLLDVIIFEAHDEIRNRQLAVWLPFQHQIQEMLGDFLWTSVLMERCFKGEYPSEWPMDTWEKRWLHLYMQVKHSKVWDGKEKKWIKK